MQVAPSTLNRWLRSQGWDPGVEPLPLGKSAHVAMDTHRPGLIGAAGTEGADSGVRLRAAWGLRGDSVGLGPVGLNRRGKHQSVTQQIEMDGYGVERPNDPNPEDHGSVRAAQSERPGCSAWLQPVGVNRGWKWGGIDGCNLPEGCFQVPGEGRIQAVRDGLQEASGRKAPEQGLDREEGDGRGEPLDCRISDGSGERERGWNSRALKPSRARTPGKQCCQGWSQTGWPQSGAQGASLQVFPLDGTLPGSDSSLIGYSTHSS